MAESGSLLKTCLAELTKGINFFEDKLKDGHFSELSMVEGFLEFIACQPLVKENSDLFRMLCSKHRPKSDVTKSITTQSMTFQPQDFVFDKEDSDSPRGSIQSDEEEKEEKTKGPKLNFAAELNN